MLRAFCALFSVGALLFVVPYPVFAVLTNHSQVSADGTTSRYIITFKDGAQADISGLANWLDSKNLGIYIRPLFTVQTVGPSFVGVIPPIQPLSQIFPMQHAHSWAKRFLSSIVSPVWAQSVINGPVVAGYRIRPAAGGPQVLGEVATFGTTSLSGRWQSRKACGSQYPIAPGLNVSGFPLNQCNPAGDPAYYTGIMPLSYGIKNPGTTATSVQSYTIQSLPPGYTCVTWNIDVMRADRGQRVTTYQGTGCTATIDFSLLPPQVGITALDYHLWFYITPAGQFGANGTIMPVPAFTTLPEVGNSCTVGVPNQCGPGNVLVCDASTKQTTGAVCKIPECIGQACVNNGSSPGSFVSGELQNVYSAVIYAVDKGGTEPVTSLAYFPSIQELRKDILAAFPENIVSVEPDLRLHTQSVPTDPYYSYQWDMHQINLDTVWQRSSNNALVKVGVVDTGVDLSHEDFSTQTFGAGRDFAMCETIGDHNECQAARTCIAQSQEYCDDTAIDDNGHGTHIAGTIAALGDNGKGIAGMAQSAQIIPVKVLNRSGDTLESWTYEGIVYAVNQGAKVVNFSVGGCAANPAVDGSCPHTVNTVSDGFRKVMDYAIHRGVVVVVAAGNENDDAQWYTPGSYNTTPNTAGKVIVVGATNAQRQRASYSNYGAIVTVAAPGGDLTSDRNGDGLISTADCQTDQCILSTIFNQTGHSFSDPHYENEAGTSMAAPHVAGMVALLLSKNPGLPLADIQQIITDTTQPVTTDKPIGNLIDVAKALAQVKEPSNINYVDPQCDLCGWCDTAHKPKPATWEACHRCLYDDQGNTTKKSYTILGCFANTPAGGVQRVMAYVFGVSGGIAFLAFLAGSALVLTSAGNPRRLQTGKETIVSAVVGLLVILFAIFILHVVGVDILQIPGFG